MPLDMTKIYEVNSYIFENHPVIVILNETWLPRVHKDNEIFLSSDYKIFRQDRTRRTSNVCHLNLSADINFRPRTKNFRPRPVFLARGLNVFARPWDKYFARDD